MTVTVHKPVRLGVITDIQYADKPDLHIGAGTETHHVRRYNRVLDKTRHAVQSLNKSNVSLTLHLGDIIDGNTTQDQTRAELHAVLSALAPLRSPVMHVVGNHCLTAQRAYLSEALKLPAAYYARALSPRWRLLVLDTVDVSIEREEGHAYRPLAERYLADSSNNAWNGAVGPEQLDWLRRQLDDAMRNDVLVIACGHLPVLGAAAADIHLMWNGAELCKIFKQYNAVVKAYFAGHYHSGGYAKQDGVHHVTFEAILDSQKDEGAWGVVELYDDRIVVDGHGDMTSRKLDLK